MLIHNVSKLQSIIKFKNSYLGCTGMTITRAFPFVPRIISFTAGGGVGAVTGVLTKTGGGGFGVFVTAAGGRICLNCPKSVSPISTILNGVDGGAIGVIGIAGPIIEEGPIIDDGAGAVGAGAIAAIGAGAEFPAGAGEFPCCGPFATAGPGAGGAAAGSTEAGPRLFAGALFTPADGDSGPFIAG
jgi:hypothetical protein